MRRFTAVLTFTLALSLALAPAALAERRAYTLDRNHAQINFTGEALLISAHGFFEKFDVDAQVDPDKLENSTVTISIDAASINTRVERRDNHLRSAEFLDVANNPKITFVSKQITKVDDQNLKITGDLTLRGATKTMDVPVRVVFFRDGNGRFKGEFQINRKDFGMNYNSRMNPVEDMVSIQFDFHVMDQQMMQQRQQQSSPPPAKPPQSGAAVQVKR